MRDVVEATGQRWDRYVVGYDLRQQAYLFESISRYGSLHLSAAALHGMPIWTGATALLAVGIAVVLWRRRRQQSLTPREPVDRRHRDLAAAVALYELLETAMGAQGIARGASTPPLRHAESLVRLGHPLADDVLELTLLYLGARFGGTPIDEEQRRAFEAKVKAVRAVRTPSQPAESA